MKLHTQDCEEVGFLDIDNEQLETVARSVGADNASRLVACWNACAGISTENLENNLPVEELAVRYNACIKQHNTLAALLKEARPHVLLSSNSVRGGMLVEIDEALSAIEAPQQL